MKYVKMLGLAAVATMALMAFVVGSASATTLDNGSGTALKAGEVLDASLIGGTARLESTGGSVLDTCTGGTVEGKITDAGGEEKKPVKGEVKAIDLTWSGCTSTTDTTGGGTLEVSWTSGKNGTVKGSGFEVTVNAFGTSCTYGLGAGSVDLGTFEGSDTNAVLNIHAVVTEQTEDKFLCPNDTVWDAEYKATNPTGATVTQI